jgi:hypothetical protein
MSSKTDKTSFSKDMRIPINKVFSIIFVFFLKQNKLSCYHVGYTNSHSNTEVKQHWAWIIFEWETLQEFPGSPDVSAVV